jgi:hypothetical protein
VSQTIGLSYGVCGCCERSADFGCRFTGMVGLSVTSLACYDLHFFFLVLMGDWSLARKKGVCDMIPWHLYFLIFDIAFKYLNR